MTKILLQVLIGLAFLGGCSYPYLSNNKVLNESRGGFIKKQIIIGMPEEVVKKCWGGPLRVLKKKSEKVDEIWIYKPNWNIRNDLYFKGGVLVGGDPNPERFVLEKCE